MNNEELTSLQSWFSQYARSFLTEDTACRLNIKLKIKHTARVRRHIMNLADSVQLDAGDKRLAEAVALLHDVGRFRQFLKYRTFNDRHSENHALLALKVINEADCLSRLSREERHLIKKAVENHNKIRLPKDKDRVIFFSRMIRDADKLDIFDLIASDYDKAPAARNPEIDFRMPRTPDIHPRYIQDILAGRLCDNRHLRNANDVKLMRLSWLFDLNFKYSFQYVKKTAYIDRIARHLPDAAEIKEITAHLEAFLQEKTGDTP